MHTHTQTQTLIVVGMHRSGTSLTAQWLHRCGLNLGDDLVGAGTGNPDGHYEDKDFLHFHMSLLKHNQIDPHYQSTTQAITPNTYFQAKARHLVQLKNELRSQWGWKEPRTCLFLPFWHSLIPNARYLVVYRHYTEVVDSLMRRLNEQNQHSFQTDADKKRMERFFLKVWINYTNQVLAFIETTPEAQYIACDLYTLLQQDTLVFDHLHAIWGFDMTYQPMQTVYKEKLLTRTPLTLAHTEEMVEIADWLYANLESISLTGSNVNE